MYVEDIVFVEPDLNESVFDITQTTEPLSNEDLAEILGGHPNNDQLPDLTNESEVE